MSKPAYEAIQKFYDLYFGRDKIAYWMGAKGEILTRKRMQELVDAYWDYFKKYDPDRLEELMRWSEGKIGFDCSGLVCACFGTPYEMSSWTLREHMVRTVGVKECKAGSILWFPGHVEIDLGFGATGGIRSEGKTIEINDNGVGGFQLGGELEGIDYSMMYNF